MSDKISETFRQQSEDSYRLKKQPRITAQYSPDEIWSPHGSASHKTAIKDIGF
jgi:hypothetical protein